MQKPTRTILALTAGSLVLGLVGAGTAVAGDHDPKGDSFSRQLVLPRTDGGHSGRGYTLGKVVSRAPLTVRSKPSTHSSALGHLRPHDKVGLVCKQHGEPVDGNSLWYRLHLNDGEGRPKDGEEHDGGRQDASDEDEEQEGVREDENTDGAEGGGTEADSTEAEGRETEGGVGRAVSERKRAWVSARYVQNLGSVKWCD